MQLVSVPFPIIMCVRGVRNSVSFPLWIGSCKKHWSVCLNFTSMEMHLTMSQNFSNRPPKPKFRFFLSFCPQSIDVSIKNNYINFFFKKIIFAKVICSWIFIQGFILIRIAWERFSGFSCDLRQNGDIISRYNMTQSDFAKKKIYYKKKLLFINNWIIFQLLDLQCESDKMIYILHCFELWFQFKKVSALKRFLI